MSSYAPNARHDVLSKGTDSTRIFYYLLTKVLFYFPVPVEKKIIDLSSPCSEKNVASVIR